MATELDTVADEWQLALDQAKRALDRSDRTFRPEELHARQRRLAEERARTTRELAALAHDANVHQTPWLAPWPITPALLGLRDGLSACIFDLDGVLTDSGILHAAAWAEVLDPLLLQVSERPGRAFIPFDRDADYRTYLDGRPRGEGIRLFLESRGIGAPNELVHELARRKGDRLEAAVTERGVNALPGARRYLESAGRAGLRRAVVSSSTRTLPMLERADLATLVDARVDAEQIANGGLRSRPAPDLIVRACELLAVGTADAVSFTHIPDGVAAARAAGVAVIGVAADPVVRERLGQYGADLVVARLADLLTPQLAALAA